MLTNLWIGIIFCIEQADWIFSAKLWCDYNSDAWTSCEVFSARANSVRIVIMALSFHNYVNGEDRLEFAYYLVFNRCLFISTDHMWETSVLSYELRVKTVSQSFWATDLWALNLKSEKIQTNNDYRIISILVFWMLLNFLFSICEFYY